MKVIWAGLLTGFIGGLVLFFLMFPIGIVLHIMGIKVLAAISKGGIFPLRYTLVSMQILVSVIGVGYFTWKEFYRKS